MKEKKFYTKSNREITYYGKEYGNLMVKNNIYLNIKTFLCHSILYLTIILQSLN